MCWKSTPRVDSLELCRGSSHGRQARGQCSGLARLRLAVSLGVGTEVLIYMGVDCSSATVGRDEGIREESLLAQRLPIAFIDAPRGGKPHLCVPA